MTQTEMIREADTYLLHVYNRFPVVFDHGEGMYLYDTDGKKYLDFGSGIGVMALGYHDEEFTEALIGQTKRLLHTSNLFYHPPLYEAAKAVAEVTGMDKVFFTNSGAEAIEGALKTAKKYRFLRDGDGGEIIAMQHAFHGRTMGALSVTGTDAYRKPFYPLVDGVMFAEFNHIDSVKSVLSDKTMAIICEPIQGEGGICPATESFLKELRQLCDERDILLIFDEIQCGMGRTGEFFAWQHYGIRPDILTTAKALGQGVPVGAFAVTERVAKASLTPGDHGTTYGGNPLVLSAVKASISIMQQRQIPKHVQALTPYFESVLDDLTERSGVVLSRRGMGFMQGLVIDQRISVVEIIKDALKEGLILLSAGGNVIRLLPPLIAEQNDIDAMAKLLGTVLKKYS